MGERQDDGGAAHGHRRRAHPGATASEGPAYGMDDTGLGAGIEELLAVVLRDTGSGALDGSEGERRAVAAFRAARDAGTHRARTRRRDDWRTREQRRAGRFSVKATLSVAVAGLTLGGVAVAAIGTAGSSDDVGGGSGPARPGTSAGVSSAPAEPSSAPASSSAPGPAATDRPGTAQDTEAQCAAYELVEGRGKAMDAAAWERLVAVAGGEEKVDAFCARQTPGTGTSRPSAPAAAVAPTAPPAVTPTVPTQPATPPAAHPSTAATQRAGNAADVPGRNP
ncbi:hypothetical protein [Streptomyces sp. NPDC018693]|uniref:hypothetical protein n=1 Tax=unclassified Streptomyces TaxID=2593676 RepID=UPI0037BACC93